jgi:glucan phosphorylase
MSTRYLSILAIVLGVAGFCSIPFIVGAYDLLDTISQVGWLCVVVFVVNASGTVILPAVYTLFLTSRTSRCIGPMANLAIVGGHTVNGVAALHTNSLKTEVFRDFYEMWPEKFSNKTNGITQCRWLKKANPQLSALITETIGNDRVTDLFQRKRLAGFAADAAFAETWRTVKCDNKLRLMEIM